MGIRPIIPGSLIFQGFPGFPYYDRLRKIKNEYVGYDLSPLHLYASGATHRIKFLLEKQNISLAEAFADNCRNRLATAIITAELERCNGIMEIGNFRELIKGHIDVFFEDKTDDVNDDLFDTKHIDSPEEYLEGEELIATHLSHERNAEVVALAKLQFKAIHSGKLFCEKCGFDFCVKYGERGTKFYRSSSYSALGTKSGERNHESRRYCFALLKLSQCCSPKAALAEDV